MLRGWGGQSNRILTEARGAIRAGHQVAFAVPHIAVLGERGREAGVEILPHYEMRPPAQFWTFIPDVLRMARDIERWKPDLIHMHGSPDTWVTVLAKRLVKGKFPPLIRTRHNMVEWNHSFLNKWLYPQIDSYVTISRYTEKQFHDYPGLTGKPMVLINSVPDVAKFSEAAESIRSEWTEIPPGAFVWGTSARMRWEKAHDILIRAFALLAAEGRPCFLILAGDGSEKGKLEELAQSLKLGPDRIKFLGFRKDVPRVLASVDAYALASRSEALGTSILEALAMGLPVVASNVGGIPDSVRHEDSGLLFESENPASMAAAMRRIMDDAALRARLSEGARRVVAEVFDEERLVRKTLEFYRLVSGLPS